MASRLEAARLTVLLAAPLLAALGIALTGWLSAGRALISRRILAVSGAACVVLWLVAVVWSAVVYPRASFVVFAAGWYAVFAGGLLLFVLGLAAVATVLWRRHWWTAVLWLVVWGGLSGAVIVSSRQTASAGDDLGGGVMFFLTGGMLVAAALVSAVVVTALIERQLAVAPIEQAH